MAANVHDGADIEFDEDRGGPRHIQNYLSMPVDGELYQSTKHIFPWEEAGAHEAPNTRFVVPSVYVEKIFAHAVVEAPEPWRSFSPTKMERCAATSTSMISTSRPT